MRGFLTHTLPASLLHPSRDVSGPTPAPRAGTPAAGSGGCRELRGGAPAGPTLPSARPARRPAPDAGWGGLLAAASRRDCTAEPQGCGGCLRATRRDPFGRREPALPAPLPCGAQRERLLPSPAGARMRSCEPWADPMTLSTLARERKAPPSCTCSLCSPDMIPYFSANAVISQNAINQLWVRPRPPALGERSESLLSADAFLSILGSQQARAKSHPVCLEVSERPGRCGVEAWGNSRKEKVSPGAGRTEESLARISGKLRGNLKVGSSQGGCLRWPSDSWAVWHSADWVWGAVCSLWTPAGNAETHLRVLLVIKFVLTLFFFCFK